jgi:HD-GYP domain-containing protein (c-di-GMP phosphodiesterase class II)
MSSLDSVKVRIEHLRSGSRIGHSIVDQDNVLLLTAGTDITDPIKKCLLDRGITMVFLHPEDAARMFSTNTRRPHPLLLPTLKVPASPIAADPNPPSIEELSDQIAKFGARVSLSVKSFGPPLKARLTRATTKPYSPQQRERLVKQFATTKKLMDTMIRHAIAGLWQDSRAVLTVAKSAVAELVNDTDQTITTSAEIPRNPEITERAVRMSVLAMAVGIELGWDEHQVREVGECGLLHDWGLHRLDETIRSQQAALSESERKQMQQHPLYTFEMLGKMREVSDAVRIAAAQVHEKLDGSGYPRGLSEDQIHPYAKVLHVADAYVSLTEETWGRPAYISYDVMVYLLSQVKNRSISIEAVRALLNVVALFPLGSHVQLSDGSEARVIRRGAGVYTEPVVQRVGADRTLRIDQGHSSIVDLSQSELKVTAPLPHPIRQEARILDTSTSAVLWE